jgi:hypothetical protein
MKNKKTFGWGIGGVITDYHIEEIDGKTVRIIDDAIIREVSLVNTTKDKKNRIKNWFFKIRTDPGEILPPFYYGHVYDMWEKGDIKGTPSLWMPIPLNYFYILFLFLNKWWNHFRGRRGLIDKKILEALSGNAKYYWLFTSEELTDIAKAAYIEYSKATKNKNFVGKEMPAFEELPENIKTAWIMAAIGSVKWFNNGLIIE